MTDARFHLYDLKVEVIEGDKPFVCSHQVGDAVSALAFIVRWLAPLAVAWLLVYNL